MTMHTPAVCCAAAKADSKTMVLGLALLALVCGCGGESASVEPQRCDPIGSSAVEVTSPAGGDQYRVGDTLEIGWKLDADSMTGSDITISIEGGEWQSVLMQEESIDPTAGKYQCAQVGWVIYDGYFAQGSSRCVLRVKDYTTESNGVSDTFTVVKP